MRFTQNIVFILTLLIIVLTSALGCNTVAQSNQTVSIPPSPSKTPVFPTEFIKDPLNGLIVVSDCIVSGNVTAQIYEVVTHGNSTWPYTYSTLTIDKVIKGDPTLKEAVIRTMSYQGQAAPGVTYIGKNAKYLICLHQEIDNLYTPESGPLPTSGPFPIDSSTAGILWDKSVYQKEDEIIARVIQIMRANQIPVALPVNEWPPLPTGPVKIPSK